MFSEMGILETRARLLSPLLSAPPVLDPALQARLGLGAPFPLEQILDADVLVQVGPVNAERSWPPGPTRAVRFLFCSQFPILVLMMDSTQGDRWPFARTERRWLFPMMAGCAFVGLALLQFVDLRAHPVPAVGRAQDALTYTVVIDCSHGAIRREGTRARYTIIGVSEDGEEVPFTVDSTDMRRLTETDCRRGVAPFTPLEPLPDTVRIRRFQIALVGGRASSDALYLDSLQLTLAGPAVADSIAWDVDGGSGWCLSEDPGDGRGDWRHYLYDDRCSPCLEFSLVPLVEGDSIVDGDWRGTATPGYAECLPMESEAGDR